MKHESFYQYEIGGDSHLGFCNYYWKATVNPATSVKYRLKLLAPGMLI